MPSGCKSQDRRQAADKATYLNLAKPSERDPVQRFASVEEGLYDKVLNRCVEDGKMCMHHMMAIDSLGGEAYMRAWPEPAPGRVHRTERRPSGGRA